MLSQRRWRHRSRSMDIDWTTLNRQSWQCIRIPVFHMHATSIVIPQSSGPVNVVKSWEISNGLSLSTSREYSHDYLTVAECNASCKNITRVREWDEQMAVG